MSRIGWVLTALLCLLLIIGWYFLIFDPTSEEIAGVREETEFVEGQTAMALARAEQLREIRAEAPAAEADLAIGRSLFPDDPSLPAVFRQLQQAGDEAGVRLSSIAPTAPSNVDYDGGSYAAIGLSLNVEGSYFQVVDFARRIEDPSITPRALLWEGANLSLGEFPELNVTLTGTVFARTASEPRAPDEPPVDDEVEDDLEGVDPEGEGPDEVGETEELGS